MTLPAAQLRRIFISLAFQSESLEKCQTLRLRLPARETGAPPCNQQIAQNGAVREQRVVLRHDPNHPLVPDQKSDNSGAAPGQTARQGRAPEPPRQERAEPAQTRPQQSPL